jgi:hypothetical protein
MSFLAAWRRRLRGYAAGITVTAGLLSSALREFSGAVSI